MKIFVFITRLRSQARLLQAAALLLLGALGACSTGTIAPEEVSTGYSYFPLKSGHYVIYKVEETVVRFLQPPQTQSFLLKEQVADSFQDGGQLVHRLLRYRFPDTTRVADYNSLNWSLDSVWTMRRSGTAAVRVENNIPFVSLAFPLREGQNWNGNLYNQLGSSDPLTYRVRDFGQRQVINGITLPKTLRVQQRNEFNCLGQDVRNEWWADNIGLVRRETTVYTFNPDSCNNRILQGRRWVQSVLDYSRP